MLKTSPRTTTCWSRPWTKFKKFKITSKVGQQLLECCKNVLQLRQSLKNQHNELVAQSLRWFQVNHGICPPHILIEAQQAYVLHQNDLLSRSLAAALAVGKGSRTVR